MAPRTPPAIADSPTVDPGSFRDPAGLVFRRDGTLYRQVNRAGAADWDLYRSSGLHDRLVADRLVVDHVEEPLDLALSPDAVAVIRPRLVEMISYPYEWSFSQLKDAALLTLDLQARALDVGMRLKDASAYNIQFDAGRPILIDTLSFEAAAPTEPWPAYRQFCEHFLAPLALMAHRDVRCGLMLREFIDGIPLDLAARLMPGRTKLNPGLLAHLHLHAGAQRRAANETPPAEGAPKRARTVSATGQRALLDSIRRTIAGLSWRPRSHWAGYATTTSYSDDGHRQQGKPGARHARRGGGHHGLGPRGQHRRVQRNGRRCRLPGGRLGPGRGERRGPLAAGARRRPPVDPAPGARPGEPVAGHRLGARGARRRSSNGANPT